MSVACSAAERAPALIWSCDHLLHRDYVNKTWLTFTGRAAEQDTMTLMAECAGPDAALESAVAADLQAITKLKGAVKLVAPGSLPNDGKVIADERPVG